MPMSPDRRTFLAGLGCLSVSRTTALGQDRANRPTIAFFRSGFASERSVAVDLFLQAMGEIGLKAGRDFDLREHYTEGHPDRIDAIASEITNSKPDLVFTSGGAAVLAISRATTRIPIVSVAVGGDPVEMRLAETWAHPGKNVTGVTNVFRGLAAKRLEMLKEISPAGARVAILSNPDTASSRAQAEEMLDAARRLGIDARTFSVRVDDDLKAVFAAIVSDRRNALITVNDSQFNDNAALIGALARDHRLIGVYGNPGMIEAGGLLVYQTSLLASYRRAVTMGVKILKGEDPGNIPFEGPTRFEMIVNMRTAHHIGIEIPTHILVRADRVIE